MERLGISASRPSRRRLDPDRVYKPDSVDIRIISLGQRDDVLERGPVVNDQIVKDA